MINKLPRVLPSFNRCLEDIGLPLKEVARYLGVTEHTIRSWSKRDQAPRAAHVCAYWATGWARRDLDVELWNEAQLAFATVRAYRDEIDRLTARLQMLQMVGDFGAANDPTIESGQFPARPKYVPRVAPQLVPLDVSLTAAL